MGEREVACHKTNLLFIQICNTSKLYYMKKKYVHGKKCITCNLCYG